ncbi:protein shisa-2 homolog isoform X3 [Centruroides sculpturatus]|uniref:protein shisa-2 homolog isoform X3 n=1 Tax=Centruroides sculpturatus TaxID=218467 RepID=UPI000C6DF4F7|nr:protein shisa-2 homolog isoform X3 [Centruroides sculpturatus]
MLLLFRGYSPIFFFHVSASQFSLIIKMEVRVLGDQDHEVLGTEYCSGYTDSFGKWNTGFYCPNLGNGEPVYCCGTTTYKYCCTKRDEEHRPAVDQTVLLGIVLGVLLAVVLVTLVSCLVCRRCLHFGRRRPAVNGGPLYRMHCSSTASGVANMYSFSGQNSAVTTPIDTSEPHVLVNLDCHHPNISNQLPVFGTTAADASHLESMMNIVSIIQGNPHGARHMFYHSIVPQEPPPPYQMNNPVSSGYNEQEPSNAASISNPSITSFTQNRLRPVACPRSPEAVVSLPSSHSSTNTTTQCNSTMTRNTIYWSTKF